MRRAYRGAADRTNTSGDLEMKSKLSFRGSNPDGYRAEIRESDGGYSVFTWYDKGGKSGGVILWREKHGLIWPDAFSTASKWLKTEMVKA